MTSFIVLILFRSCLISAKKKLVPNIYDQDEKLINPEYFNVNVTRNGFDPFTNFAEVPRMAYLDMNDDNTTLTDD